MKRYFILEVGRESMADFDTISAVSDKGDKEIWKLNAYSDNDLLKENLTAAMYLEEPVFHSDTMIKIKHKTWLYYERGNTWYRYYTGEEEKGESVNYRYIDSLKK